MSRLTNREYLRIHRQLGYFYRQDKGLYASLTPREQWLLHDFFQPAHDLPNRQLLDHRRAITKARPSLPHQAGRALSKLRRHSAGLQEVVPVTEIRNKPVKVTAVQVRGIVRPKPDLHKLVEALQAMARNQAEADSDPGLPDRRPHDD
jgi:hypothetical protein